MWNFKIDENTACMREYAQNLEVISKVVSGFNWLKHHLEGVRADVPPGLEAPILEPNKIDLTQSSESDNIKHNGVNSK
ncbi:hypothetical protein HAX54_022051, partial [Datura stramonium]|nr:hypothetical protein [Datura stramonium]